jgi:hypothetical protein
VESNTDFREDRFSNIFGRYINEPSSFNIPLVDSSSSAEEGLARLQEIIILDSSNKAHTLYMAHAPPNQQGIPACKPTSPVSCALRMVKSRTGQVLTDSEVYEKLRRFGPLHTFRECDSSLGYAFLIQFWDKSDAGRALKVFPPIAPKLFSLYEYNPLSVLCTVSY